MGKRAIKGKNLNDIFSESCRKILLDQREKMRKEIQSFGGFLN